MSLKQCEKGHFFDPNKHTSCPLCGVGKLDMDLTRPYDRESVEAPGSEKTVGVFDATPLRSGEGKTVGIYRKKMGMDPVVGWLVCVKGPDRGRDYRIRSEKNFIGRAREMDICIAGDSSISREKHAIISFDPKNCRFILIPGEANSLVYLNGDAIYGPQPINSHDKIELGDSELLFVPFCGENFKWT